MQREPDFLELRADETVQRGVVKRHPRPHIAFAIACVLGAWAAYWIASKLPYVAIHADADGRWEHVEIDWSRTML